MGSDIEALKSKMREELDQLRYEFKIELPKAIATAAALGDLKENADYHAARERQSFVQSKIAQLAQQLASLNNIDVSKIPKNMIDYGSQISLVDNNSGDKMELTLVSTNEVKPSEGKISVSSPYGNALRGKSVGESVIVKTPAGEKDLYIEKFVSYHGDEFKKKK